MKTLIVVSLYVLGAMIFAIWVVVLEENIEKFNKLINDDPDTKLLPEKVIKIILYVVVLMGSLIWPYFIIVSPIKAVIEGLKK